MDADALGNITNFYMDRYIDGTAGSIANGTYGPQSFGTLDSFGYGTLNLGPYTLSYFLVNSGHIIVIASSSSDLMGLPAGHMYSQSSAAPSLAGTYIFTLAGSTPTPSANGASVVGSFPQALGGWLTSDLSGNLNGYLDTNNNGTVQGSSVSGTLVPSADNGRWIMTLSGGGASRFALYPTISHGLLMLQLDTQKSGIGAALVQAVPLPTFQGTYAASVQQLGLVNVARNPSVALPVGPWTDISGQIIASSSSGITGTLDVDQVNGLFLGPSGNFWTQTPGVSLTGGFAVGAQGRDTGTLTLNQLVSITTNQPETMSVILYVVDDTTAMLLENDGSPAAGILQVQKF